MLKEHATVVRRLTVAGDALMASVGFVLAYQLVSDVRPLRSFTAYRPLLVPFILLWLILLRHAGMYESWRTRKLSQTTAIILKTAAMGFLGFGAALFTFRAGPVNRSFIAATFVVTAMVLIAERLALVWTSHYTRKKGYNYRGLLIVGTGRRTQQFIRRIHQHAEWGLRIVGLVDEDPHLTGQQVCGHPVLGTLADISAIIHQNVVDEVIFVVPRSWLHKIEDVMQFCEMEGLKVSVAMDFFDLKLARVKHADWDGLPLMTFGTTPDQIWHLVAKRTIDILVSSAALILLAPVWAVIAMAIKADSPGPVFFRQQRCGLNGRLFTLYKFRTMVRDAEAQLPQLLRSNEMEGPVFKITKDPRATNVGRFLRKTSLDELPQLWNVLWGEMSLVGPRPPLPVEVQRYDNWQRRKMSMRPGVTCLWQVNGRNNIKSFNDWVKMDLSYIDNWSLGLDWKILAKTVPAVVLGVGAK